MSINDPIQVGDHLVRVQVFEVTHRSDKSPLFGVRNLHNEDASSEVGEQWLRENCMPLSAELAQVLAKEGTSE